MKYTWIKIEIGRLRIKINWVAFAVGALVGYVLINVWLK
jgi:hypothetical protein